NSYDQLVNQIINTTKYLSFNSSADAREWKTYLNGSKLQERGGYNTSSSSFDSYASAGYESSIYMHLCSNGQFLLQQYSASYFGGTDVGGDVSSGTTESRGKWAVMSIAEQIVVRVVYENGEIEYYPVKREGGYIYSGDSRFTKDVSDVCR
ncbi:MAG: hypothetical protein AAF696_32955, partial [Bacteroidota bacterium]